MDPPERPRSVLPPRKTPQAGADEAQLLLRRAQRLDAAAAARRARGQALGADGADAAALAAPGEQLAGAGLEPEREPAGAAVPAAPAPPRRLPWLLFGAAVLLALGLGYALWLRPLLGRVEDYRRDLDAEMAASARAQRLQATGRACRFRLLGYAGGGRTLEGRTLLDNGDIALFHEAPDRRGEPMPGPTRAAGPGSGAGTGPALEGPGGEGAGDRPVGSGIDGDEPDPGMPSRPWRQSRPGQDAPATDADGIGDGLRFRLRRVRDFQRDAAGELHCRTEEVEVADEAQWWSWVEGGAGPALAGKEAADEATLTMIRQAWKSL